MSIRSKLGNYAATRLSRFRIIRSLSGRIVQIYDNDCNTNLETNGERDLLRFLRGNAIIDPETSPVLFDIGANVGAYSSLLSKTIGNNSKIYAFDPSPDNILAINKLSIKNLTAVQAAISDTDGMTSFYENMDRRHSGTDSLADMNSIGYVTDYTVRQVRIEKLDTFSAREKIEHIQFLKMDIEGGEYRALIGASRLLSSHSIDFIQFEFGHAARAFRVLFLDIFQLFQLLGYEVYVIKPKRIELIRYTPFFETRYNMGNFFAARKPLHLRLKGYIHE